MNLLLLIFAATLPTVAGVETFHRGRNSGTCVMFTNGVCVCSEPDAYVRDFTCHRTETVDEAICSYNVVMEDMAHLEPPFAEQRMDTFKLDSEGHWQFARTFHEPVTIEPFTRS